MKVLYLTNLPSPYRVDFFNELGRLCDLTVLYERRTAGDRDALWKAHKAETFHEVYLDGKPIGTDSSLSFRTKQYLKEPYDIVVVCGYTSPTAMLAIQYLRRKKKRFFLCADGGIVKGDGGWKRKLKQHFIGAATAWLSTGAQCTAYLTHYGASAQATFVYPFTSLRASEVAAAFPEEQEKQQMREQLGITEPNVVLSVGQFIPRKGFDILMRAAQRMPESVGIYIVGGEPTEEYLTLKESLGVKHVHFVGFQTKEQLAAYYKAADLFVLPTREDIWGLVVNEAMAYGLPVVTTNNCVAGLELVKDGETGYLVPVEDETALADRISRIIEDGALRRSMAQNSLTAIRSYTVESMAARHVEIFKAFLAGAAEGAHEA